jgi:hypothetical protein
LKGPDCDGVPGCTFTIETVKHVLPIDFQEGFGKLSVPTVAIALVSRRKLELPFQFFLRQPR